MSDHEYYTGNSEGKLIKIPPIDELWEILAMKFKSQEDTINYWRNKYNDAIAGNKEYQKLLIEKKEIEERLYNGFGIFNSEKEAINKWYQEHKEKHLHPHLTYKFIPLGIGTVGEIECDCGAKFRFRDID